MNRYALQTRIWVALTLAIALSLVPWSIRDAATSPSDWWALCFLSVVAAVAHAFPIRSAVNGASFRLTNVFLVAGVIILPPVMLPLAALLAITPDSLMRRRSPGAFIRWAFNVAQTVVAGLLASGFYAWSASLDSAELVQILAVIVTGLLFGAVQVVFVGIALSVNTSVPLLRVETFTLPHLQSAAMGVLFGGLVAGLWLFKPILLLLGLPLVVLSYFLSKGAHLAHLAQVDVKTGLHNYRHFEAALDDETRRSQRLRRTFALLFFDMDLLRKVNSEHGHVAGDRVLQQVATILLKSLRPMDVIARFGGEKFVALLPETDMETAARLANQVRETVANHRFLVDDNQEINCTVSVGIAVFPDDARPGGSLIEQADLAMHSAKQTRNAISRVPNLPIPKPSMPKSATTPPIPMPTPLAAQLALWCVVSTGAVAVGWSFWLVVIQSQAWLAALPFLGAAATAELVKVRVFEAKSDRITLSFAVAATMASVAVMPIVAPLTAFVAAVVHVLFIQQQRSIEKVFFNLANPALAASAAAGIYVFLAPIGGVFGVHQMAAALSAVIFFHVVNFGLIALMISLHTRSPLGGVLVASAWYSPTKLFIGLTGAILGGVYTLLGFVGVLMFLVPLAILKYSVTLYTTQSDRTISELQKAKSKAEQAELDKAKTLAKLIETISNIIDARDNTVAGHSKSVAKYAVAIGAEMNLSNSELDTIHTAGLLHDMGKVAMSEAILHKPGRLTDEEYETIKEHASLGERILAEVGQLAEIARIVGEHHERWDGLGYPRQKCAGEISVGGRIMAVADTLDSILTDRPYSKGKSLTWALEELDRCAGTQFDPEVVAALHQVLHVHGTKFFEMGSDTASSDQPSQTFTRLFA